MTKLIFKLFFCFLGFCFVAVLSLNTVLVLPIILIFALVKLLPVPWLKLQCQRILNEICIYWVSLNNVFVHKLLKIEPCHLDSDLQLSKQCSYLVISNHQSWLDILILQSLLHIDPFVRTCLHLN